MRVGVVGVGNHASASLYPNLAAAGLDLVATCARHRDRAKAAATRWGASAAFDDVAAMLSGPELDGVVVCVPPADYAPIIEACLKAGLPVYCEKPGAATAAEAEQLARLSATVGQPVVVGYMKRFAPSYQRAREIIVSDQFGPPSLGSFTFAIGPWLGGDYADYVIDNTVHHLDLARFMLGELGELNAEATTIADGRHAIAVSARAETGAVCTFNFNTTGSWEQRNEHVEVYGEGHAVWVDNLDTCVYRPPERPEQVWRPNYTVGMPANLSPVITGFVPALTHFRTVVAGEVPNLSDMASATATLRLAEQLLRHTQDRRGNGKRIHMEDL